MKVRTRPLGRTGLRVSELSLGTWGLSGDGYGGGVDSAQAERVVARAADMGFSLFDTADAYGAGRMEVLLGRALKNYPGATVVTKVGTDRTTDPPRKRFEHAYIVESCERSLRRLGRERIDIYLLHNPSATVLEAGEAPEAMIELRQQGKIRHWGVSVGDHLTGRAAIHRDAEVIELPYNLFHSSDLHRLGGEIVVGKVGVLARSTLAYGLLAGLWHKEKEFAAGDHRQERWTKNEFTRRLEQLDGVRFLVRGDIHSLRAAAVRFVLANQLVSTAVLGPRTVEQLEQLVREVGTGPIYLSDEDLAQLPRTLDRFGIGM